MIKLSSSCAEIIAAEVSAQKRTVLLPSDICQSVVSILDQRNLPHIFYPVKRSWSSNTFDQYNLPYVEDPILLVSDLFNFRSINVQIIKKYCCILDLAHCSLETAQFYSQYFQNNLSIFMCISFGKGKYYRYGGGGIGFAGSDIPFLKLRSTNSYNHNLHEELGLFGSKHNSTSTRIVLENNPDNQRLVDDLRSRGISVSDGLYDNITNISNNEFYVWK